MLRMHWVVDFYQGMCRFYDSRILYTITRACMTSSYAFRAKEKKGVDSFDHEFCPARPALCKCNYLRHELSHRGIVSCDIPQLW